MKFISRFRLAGYIYTLLALLLALYLTSCMPLPKAPVGSGRSLPIDARLASFNIQPFDKSRIQQGILRSMGSVEGQFRDQLYALLDTGDFFDTAGSREVRLKAELMSWRDTSFSSIVPDMEVEVKYSLYAEDGTLLLTKVLTSKGQASGVWLVGGIYRSVRAANRAFANNLEAFGSVLASELPAKWAEYKVKGGGVFAQKAPPQALPPRLNLQAETPVANLDGLGQYHALLIGNNAYAELPRLKTAVNDVVALGQTLKKDYGFRVTVLKNASRAEILKTLNGLRTTLAEGDNLLIYYAGHGWLDTEADEGYWLPVDAQREDPTNWISNSSIANTLRALRSKHVLVVADSCYSGKLSRGVKIASRGTGYYRQIARKRSRTVLASGGLEPVSDGGGDGDHSIFAAEILKALRGNPGLMDGTTLFSQIRRPVVLNSEQTPEYSDIRRAGHDGGDFIFARLK